MFNVTKVLSKNNQTNSTSNMNGGFKTSNEGVKQPTVHHIPIFVEGRDEPMVNKILTPNSTNFGKSGIDDSVKFMGRTRSPHGGIDFTKDKSTEPVDIPDGVQKEDINNTSTASLNETPTTKENVIDTIQCIQQEVLKLMDNVSACEFNSKRDPKYVYMDEMLTQNLLKLDTINADGNDVIKKARKEAIHAINKCIEALEAKAESSTYNKVNNFTEAPSNTIQQTNPKAAVT